jgi:hypothetical protein
MGSRIGRDGAADELFAPEPGALKWSKLADCDSTVSQPEHFSGRHRDTLLEIFQHPTSHNIEWPDVISLLEATGSVDERHDGKFRVRLGSETEVFTTTENQRHRRPGGGRPTPDAGRGWLRIIG